MNITQGKSFGIGGNGLSSVGRQRLHPYCCRGFLLENYASVHITCGAMTSAPSLEPTCGSSLTICLVVESVPVGVILGAGVPQPIYDTRVVGNHRFAMLNGRKFTPAAGDFHACYNGLSAMLSVDCRRGCGPSRGYSERESGSMSRVGFSLPPKGGDVTSLQVIVLYGHLRLCSAE